MRAKVHWLKINERIEYKLLSRTHKVLTTSQPDYLACLHVTVFVGNIALLAGGDDPRQMGGGELLFNNCFC